MGDTDASDGVAYAATSRLLSGAPIYKRAASSEESVAPAMLFRWSGGTWSEWRIGPRLDGAVARFAVPVG